MHGTGWPYWPWKRDLKPKVERKRPTKEEQPKPVPVRIFTRQFLAEPYVEPIHIYEGPPMDIERLHKLSSQQPNSVLVRCDAVAQTVYVTEAAGVAVIADRGAMFILKEMIWQALDNIDIRVIVQQRSHWRVSALLDYGFGPQKDIDFWDKVGEPMVIEHGELLVRDMGSHLTRGLKAPDWPVFDFREPKTRRVDRVPVLH